MMLIGDPLKISYLVMLASEDPRNTTPFQGFSPSWQPQHWALYQLATLPADILEPSQKQTDLIAQRMGGLRALSWAPLFVSALKETSAEDLAVHLVRFTGEDVAAKAVSAWAKKQKYPVLHVSTIDVEGAVRAQDLNFDTLHQYCSTAFDAHKANIPKDRFEPGKKALAAWKAPTLIPINLNEDGHNILIPNYMSLSRAFRSMNAGKAFLGDSEKEYAEAILASVKAIDDVRREVGIKPLHYLSLLRPGLVLAEPAFYRGAYKRIGSKGPAGDKTAARTMRMLQTQKGLHTETDSDFLDALQTSPMAQQLIGMRQSELETFTLAVGLHAAQSTAGVLRLSPGVNHVFPSLSMYARSMRSNSLENRLKTRRLFDTIQTDLARAVGAERIAHIKADGGPFKIISDAPIEWLPIDGLPLSMRFDCSRINATPGNLMIGTLLEPITLTFPPKELQKILVVSSFAKNDRLKNMMTVSIGAVSESLKGKVEVVFKSASTVKEFVDVLNAYDGYIMVFDGHGANNADEPIGKLAIGGELVDVWELHRKVRVPPIVILSACDTHGIDASTHATVGNGFLFLGARTVLATMLPVSGTRSAAFVARLLYRLADFLPAAISAKKRVLNWEEVISGMLRMTLASEILDDLVGPPEPPETPRGKLQTEANGHINIDKSPIWYERLIEGIAEHKGSEMASIAGKAASVVARADSIRYVQFGNPECILIDDGSIRKKVLAEYGQAAST